MSVGALLPDCHTAWAVPCCSELARSLSAVLHVSDELKDLAGPVDKFAQREL